MKKILLSAVVLVLLVSCAKQEDPPMRRKLSSSHLWTAVDSMGTPVYSSAGEGRLLLTAEAGSRWVIEDSVVVPIGPKHLWFRVSRGQQKGWVDSGRAAHDKQNGEIATH